MIGKITGRTIAKNRDGDVDRILLQVEVIPDEDVRTVELFTQAGDDTNPGNGCRVNIVPISNSYHVGIGVSDDLVSECDAGEKEFYSTDSPVTVKKARLKLDKNSRIIMNQGVNHAAQYEALNTKLQLLIMAINSVLATKLNGAGSAGTLTLDITSAKVDTVRLP
jgi:hypothetical protein